jgi:hypothetical protein
MPGAVHPDDVTQEQVTAMLASGRYAIDWWEGDPREGMDELSQAEYLRPSIKGMEGWRHDPSWGGECVFLTPTGCELSAAERPSECRALQPRQGEPCEYEGLVAKRTVATAWLEHADWLKDVGGGDQSTYDPTAYLAHVLDRVNAMCKAMGLD